MGTTIASIIARVSPNNIISRKIDASVEMAQTQIESFYVECRRSVFIIALLNGLFLAVLFTSSLIDSVKTVGIIIAFFLLLAIIGRSLYVFVRCIKWAIPYRRWIVDFIKSLVEKRSLRKTVKDMLRHTWRDYYGKKTNSFTARFHSVIAKTRIVKSSDEIGDEVAEKHYSMIRNCLIGNLMFKALAVFIILCVYLFFLQPLVIHLALGMSLVDIVIFPITLIQENSNSCA